MANIKILGDAAVLTSTIKFANLKEMYARHPEACTAYSRKPGGDVVPEFSVLVSGNSGSLNENGVIFSAEDDNGYSTCTMLMPKGMTNAKKLEYVKDKWCEPLAKLNRFEEHFATEFASYVAFVDEAMADVSIVDTTPVVLEAVDTNEAEG